MSRGRDERCQICNGSRFTTVHRQEFVLPDDIRTHYLIVACEGCGFVFARDLPTAEEYERYYRSNLKYTYEGSRDGAAALFSIHQGSFEIVDRNLPRNQRHEARILDIGCSTGELLALFQRNGYQRLFGVDPTPECRVIAERLYGLEIQTAVLSELQPGEPYDVVLLANVLEHIPNLHDAMSRIASFVKDGGFLFVQVPDAGNFGHDMREPFLEFSIEHINYFTETSLANLLGEFGFTTAELQHDVVSYKGAHYPVITSVWKKAANAPAVNRSKADADAVRRYTAKSVQRMAEICETIDALVASGESVVIWGVGSLTARFLATTSLERANIVGFVDSNTGHHGKRILGREIAPPSSLAGKTDTVFISSFVYGTEIRNTLERDIHYTGRIVTL